MIFFHLLAANNVAALRAVPRSRADRQDAAPENCVSGEAAGRTRCQYPYPCQRAPSSEDVLREVEERLLASPHIPEEWWILGPPTCPPFTGTCAPCDHDPDPHFLEDACSALCPAAHDAPGCGEAHGCESVSDTDGRECPQFHVDVDLHVAAVGEEDARDACVFGCECQPPAGPSVPTEVNLVSRGFTKMPLENLPDVVDNCSEREVCVEAAGESREVEGVGRECRGGGGGSNQQRRGGPSRSRKRRTIYV